MADTKSYEELATELTIEYLKAKPATEADELQQVWCRFCRMMYTKGQE